MHKQDNQDATNELATLTDEEVRALTDEEVCARADALLPRVLASLAREVQRGALRHHSFKRDGKTISITLESTDADERSTK